MEAAETDISDVRRLADRSEAVAPGNGGRVATRMAATTNDRGAEARAGAVGISQSIKVQEVRTGESEGRVHLASMSGDADPTTICKRV